MLDIHRRQSKWQGSCKKEEERVGGTKCRARQLQSLSGRRVRTREDDKWPKRRDYETWRFPSQFINQPRSLRHNPQNL